MFKFNSLLIFSFILSLFTINKPVLAQLSETAKWAINFQSNYRTKSNITYLKANNVELKLDVFAPRNPQESVPTVIYFHGGGWIGGNKNNAMKVVLPYLEKGWGAVTVEYRLASVSPAPAAVEDCLCALRWVIKNADKYGFDVDKIVVFGDSAGGHLALTTGMIPESAGLDRQCYGKEELKVAAIINWYGVTDVEDLLEGENEKRYAIQWLGSQSDRNEVAQRVSPINYVGENTPPIITIHGDADSLVPYTHATRLHQALDEAEIPNELITIPDGRHGGFTQEEMFLIYETIYQFLDKHLQ